MGVVAAVNGYDLYYCAADHCWYAAGAFGDSAAIAEANVYKTVMFIFHTISVVYLQQQNKIGHNMVQN